MPKPDWEWMRAPEVAAVAEPIIEKHHKHLLQNKVRVDFYFTSKAPVVKGRQEYGRCTKISGLAAFLADERGRNERWNAAVERDYNEKERALRFDEKPQKVDIHEGVSNDFFVITIWKDAWDMALSCRQQDALLDHELCHASSMINDDGDLVLAIMPHQINEFRDVIKRHGPWDADIASMLKAVEEGPQLTFDEISYRAPQGGVEYGRGEEFSRELNERMRQQLQGGGDVTTRVTFHAETR